ncbi:4-hydroxybutyrate coenzyme A transferase [Cutibacterium acnes JCM 18918]|nr:4-hydroxybutyrate coenzyme A transferase [Cutibacterium acnes JCM 18918]
MTGRPRVVCAGSGATPLPLLDAVDRCLETWRFACVNAPVGVPTRKGVIHQTVFIGPGSRHAENLEYVPCRLSLAPRLYEDRFAPDILLLHTSTPHNGAVSMGIEVQVLPAALESAKRRGALVIAQVNPSMPMFSGTELSMLTTSISESLSTPRCRRPLCRRLARLRGGLASS